MATSCGEKWKKHRKMLTPAFHFDILKQYVPVYNEVLDKLLVKTNIDYSYRTILLQ